MDRNRSRSRRWWPSPPVALRKESVDRNNEDDPNNLWSEVALRKESVDRNRGGDTHANRYYVSLSARRAWIEIRSVPRWHAEISRSLSARRAWIEIAGTMVPLSKPVSRSPQGERG